MRELACDITFDDPVDGLALGDDNLTFARRALDKGDPEAAIDALRKILEHHPDLSARRALVLALLWSGDRVAAYREWLLGPMGRGAGDWLQVEIEKAFEAERFSLAGDLAGLLARHRWASRWWPGRGRWNQPPERVPREAVTASKLRHDAGQFRHLVAKQLLGRSFEEIAQRYDEIATDLEAKGGPDARRPMDAALRGAIADSYNRIVCWSPKARVLRALSEKWSPKRVEAQFLERGTGVVVIDNFLTPEALAAVQDFAKESTVWSGTRYLNGRLGAFFNDGFNCPLLLQIAEELRNALPGVITKRYPLRQIWGFKNSADLPPDSNLHADFAAVNVNFWITPGSSNAEQTTGGMVVYDVDAPLGWDFHTYNGRSDIIQAFLWENSAMARYIPYRENRCIIFNSDLFHGTHEVQFRPGFDHHRINVTMLYGQRENDQHHPCLTGRGDLADRWGMTRSAWRSPAFSRFRR